MKKSHIKEKIHRLELLAAISILCQGYLTMRATLATESLQEDTVIEALTKIGWVKHNKKTEEIKKFIKRKNDEEKIIITGDHYWLKPLIENHKSFDTENFVIRIKEELFYEDSHLDRILELIKFASESDKASSKLDRMVARTYLAIVDKT